MNEAEANKQLKELAATNGKAKLDAQDYRRQRRLIIARFSASDCASMDETMEWHDPKSRGEDTAELQVPENGDDTAEIKVVKRGFHYTLIGCAVVSVLLIVYLVWRIV